MTPTISKTQTEIPTNSPTPSATGTSTPSPTVTATPTIVATSIMSPTRTPFNPDTILHIKGVYPNPMGAEGAVLLVNATFQSTLRIKVHNLRGELVYDRSDLGALGMGDNRVIWKPLNSSGKPLAYGAYYLEAFAEGDGRSAKAKRWISVLQ